MYTQCPECHTVFAVTEQQLDAREGVVRCGQCAAIFQADAHLLDALPERHPQPEQAPAAFHKVPGTEDKEERPADTASSLIEHPLRRKPQRRGRSLLWAFGNCVLLIALIGQYVFIYRGDLAQEPKLEPWLTQACEFLDCEIPPLQDVSKIELVEVEVAPHPKFDKALRIRMSLVNQAAFVQAYPLMEISLTNTSGVVLGRRTFSPKEYLEKPQKTEEGMVPNIAASALLEITQPDDSAVGYEIQLLASPS